MVARHPVADFDTWRKGFEDNQSAREAAGILGHHINRAEDDPNMVSTYFAVSDVDKAREFLESDDLKAIMKEVGVIGPPEIAWLSPVREAVIWDRELPGMMVSHTVADFDKWLEGYDAADEMRESAGIIGHAANRSMDDPSRVLVYHQAESFDALRSFLADPGLQAAMKDAGVTSEPEATFHVGGWANMY